jgi:hypothetical protein
MKSTCSQDESYVLLVYGKVCQVKIECVFTQYNLTARGCRHFLSVYEVRVPSSGRVSNFSERPS